jgi:GNAT superfamily N-acetyltransferase
MSPTVIRTARPSDASPVADLIAQLGSPEGTDGVGPRIAELADTPTDAVLVAEVDGRVVGLVSLHVTPFFNRGTSRGRVTALVVDESVRGRGIGKELLTAVEDAARARGCVETELTSAAHRRDAHRFYLNAGYEGHPYRFRKPLTNPM